MQLFSIVIELSVFGTNYNLGLSLFSVAAGLHMWMVSIDSFCTLEVQSEMNKNIRLTLWR